MTTRNELMGEIRAYLYAAPPDVILFHLENCCRVALYFVNRREFPVAVRQDLLARWKYLSSFVRHLQYRRGHQAAYDDPQESAHLQNTMLPLLVLKNLNDTLQAVERYCRRDRPREEWLTIWKSFANSPVPASAG